MGTTSAGIGLHDAVERIWAPLDAHHPGASRAVLEAVCATAAGAHRDQWRATGDPYVSHPLQVAQLCAEWGLPPVVVHAAVLHDVVEDTDLDLDQTVAAVPESERPQLARLVDGVTKLDSLHLHGVAGSRGDAKSDTLIKLLAAVAADPLVLAVKLADRLHNIRTLGALPEEKRRRIATETMDVFAPLASRLGMATVATELEDRCFATLYPERYERLAAMVEERVRRTDWAERVLVPLREALADAGVECELSARTKGLWSLYTKMVRRDLAFEEVGDVQGIRVVCPDVRGCYSALGVVHQLWVPVPGSVEDYVAVPKPSRYRSLHTTVTLPDGEPAEVQIRTQEMHHQANWGVCAHWRYKQGGDGPTAVVPEGEDADAEALLAAMRDELAADDEVYVLTPRGDVVALPAGSTGVDFAYAVHSQLGDRTSGVKVNGKLVTLDTVLRSGQRVEVVARGSGPSQDWLSFVRTTKARTRIRRALRERQENDPLDTGRSRLDNALTRASMPRRLITPGVLANVATGLGFPSVAALTLALGRGGVSEEAVIEGVRSLVAPAPRRRAPRRAPSPSELRVEGLAGIACQPARCCDPQPGDVIEGWVSRAHRVVVHRADCPQRPRHLPPVAVAWVASGGGVRVDVHVEGFDRPRLLRDVAAAIADAGADISDAASASGGDRVARLDFALRLSDPAGVAPLLDALRGVDGVIAADQQPRAG
ncbi:MAG: RelA/SpoT family protein [Acidimicrobiia bacterium]|nr:RelA/SpoT family protein [Acidimicrobiia bacterium]